MSSVLANGSNDICLLVCPALDTYLHYQMDEKEKLTELLRLKGAAVLTFSVLVGHGYVQHRRCSW